jgi:Uri superfamily endonuclease
LNGSYILFIHIIEQIPVSFRRKTAVLEPGYYLYIGSAYGGGGLSSRLHRHIRKSKKKHWHIDQVTMSKSSSIEGIAVSIGKDNECEIAQKLSKIEGMNSIEGFGNSDCNSCSSHFFKLLY